MIRSAKTETILAIRPGRREMGVAVLEGPELRYWGVSRFRQKDPKPLLAALDRRLNRWVRLYDPGLVATETPAPVRVAASPCLAQIEERIRATARASALPFRAFTPSEIREGFCGFPRATRREMAARVTTTYPHLDRYRGCSSRWREEYWMAMFVAVAIGRVCNTG